MGSSYKKIQKRSSSVNGETGRTYYVQWSGNLFQALMSSPQAPEPEVDFPWAANDQAIRFRSLLRCYNFPYHFLMHHSIISHPVPAFTCFVVAYCSVPTVNITILEVTGPAMKQLGGTRYMET